MIDLDTLKCTCFSLGVSGADRKMAERLGITEEQAHNLMDLVEQCLDESLTEKWAG